MSTHLLGINTVTEKGHQVPKPILTMSPPLWPLSSSCSPFTPPGTHGPHTGYTAAP